MEYKKYPGCHWLLFIPMASDFIATYFLIHNSNNQSFDIYLVNITIPGSRMDISPEVLSLRQLFYFSCSNNILQA